MFIDDNYDDDRQNAIQAILNASMGRAAKSLSLVIGGQVNTSEPATHWINRNNLKETLQKINQPDESILMLQSFRGHLRGEMIILLEPGAKLFELGQLMGYSTEMSPQNRQELTLELANILCGACISGLSEQLKITLTFGAPSIVSRKGSVHSILSNKDLKWTDALFMNVNYEADNIAMKATLIVSMTEQDSHELYSLIDTQLSQS
jgi:chemotaxis protein CheC